MPRLSIDISAKEHQQLKAIAALKGKSIKDYVLERTLVDAVDTSQMSEEEALAALNQFLSDRIDEAKTGKVAHSSAEEIGREARQRLPKQ